VVSSDRLAPGTVGHVKATVDTANRHGRLEKHVTIYSNDRTNPVLTLSLSLEIMEK
jgi:hypothetical protein